MRSMLDLPASRICEYQPKNAAAAVTRLIEQRGAIGLGQLPGQKETQSRSPATGEEGLEDAVNVLPLHPWAPVRHLEIGAAVRRQASATHLDRRVGAGGLAVRVSVPHRILAEIPHDLPQLARIEAHLDLGSRAAHPQPLARPLHGLTELLAEFLAPGLQRQLLETRFLTARQPEHAVDDAAH